jgi:hypothetical protein
VHPNYAIIFVANKFLPFPFIVNEIKIKILIIKKEKTKFFQEVKIKP